MKNKAEVEERMSFTKYSKCEISNGANVWPKRLSALRAAAKCVGAKVVRSLYFGLVAQSPDGTLDQKGLRKAHRAGDVEWERGQGDGGRPGRGGDPFAMTAAIIWDFNMVGPFTKQIG